MVNELQQRDPVEQNDTFEKEAQNAIQNERRKSNRKNTL